MTLILLHVGLVQKCLLLGRSGGWALIKVLVFQGGCLIEGGRLLTFWAFAVRALIRGGRLIE